MVRRPELRAVLAPTAIWPPFSTVPPVYDITLLRIRIPLPVFVRTRPGPSSPMTPFISTVLAMVSVWLPLRSILPERLSWPGLLASPNVIPAFIWKLFATPAGFVP